ncbi:MAG: tetraacyldisaccharide 4'-kinase [Bacillota bacterium]
MPPYEYFKKVLTGEEKGWRAFCWRGVLFALAAFYACLLPAVRFIKWHFRRMMPVFTVSVGNLTAGGTGKTPVVIYLAERFLRDGIRPAVLLRGYRAQSAGKIRIVSDENQLLLTPEQAGDEAYLLGLKLPGVPVLADANRFRAALAADARFHPDVLVLDDAFQQWSLRKDVEIALVDAADPFGPCWLLPAGTMREFPSALRRSDILLLTRTDQVPRAELEKLVKKLKGIHPKARIIHSIHKPSGVADLADWREARSSISKPASEIAVLTAIGNPASFMRSLENMGYQVMKTRVYPDHYWFQPADLLRYAGEAASCGIEHIVITEKDAVKFPPVSELGSAAHWWVLTMELKIIEGEEQLWEFIKK